MRASLSIETASRARVAVASLRSDRPLQSNAWRTPRSHNDHSSRGHAPEVVPDERDEGLFETIRRFKGMEREVVVLVELPTAGERLDELLYVGLTRATTELLGIAPPELARRLR